MPYSSLCFAPKYQADGRAGKVEGFPQKILQVALIGKVHQLLIIHKEDKGRGGHMLLCAIINLQPASVGGRRLQGCLGIRKHIVQHAGGNALGVLRVSLADHVQHRMDPLPRHGRKQTAPAHSP